MCRPPTWDTPPSSPVSPAAKYEIPVPDQTRSSRDTSSCLETFMSSSRFPAENRDPAAYLCLSSFFSPKPMRRMKNAFQS
ncbi:unnamed protein product [Pleuronectes platessa]|uniref:Uncharacterized protein n=1 Tax=Pleuronectes platessa TaxID=8262 RepID=A0A9N7TUJ0_PLEPL|nr:unnamed protein product [Pleuronectes platessa]